MQKFFRWIVNFKKIMMKIKYIMHNMIDQKMKIRNNYLIKYIYD
jgi:hypothetical protein